MEFDDVIKPKIENGANIGNIINLYKTPPFGRLTLEECQDLFRQRIEALAIIEKSEIGNELTQVIANLFREIKSHVYKTNCILLRENDHHQRKLDHHSHMLVRLYCIYNNNLWDWFKRCEKRLLNYRLRDQANRLTASQLETILRSFDFNFTRVIGEELKVLYEEKLIGWDRLRRDRERVDIFKVKFVDAIKFIGRRSVSLKNGFAFLTKYEIISVVCDVFERHLDSELNYARQHLNTELLQTQYLLESLRIVYLDHQEKIDEENRYKKTNSEARNPYSIDIHNLDETVKKHYAPCMRYLHDSLMEDHHLKHSGRLYYGAFLRSGGVDMDAAIEFWRREFTKKIPNDKFERDYKYNIRHLYGREGHKKALSCFSCDKIINDNPPSASEKHGCPFRHFDDPHLKTMLTKHGLNNTDIESIFLHRNEKEYKLACTHYFKFIKGELPTEPIKNPIHYYYESMRLANRPPEIKQEAQDMDDDEFDTMELDAKQLNAAAEVTKMVDSNAMDTKEIDETT